MIQSRPFLVAFIAGLTAQALKVVTFLILEKRVNYRRFVEAHGTPNMHSATFGALALCVGLRDGFGSLEFTLAVCVTAMASVDIWNVKRAASRHAELIDLIIDRIRRGRGDFLPRHRAMSYTPVDVLTGTALGCLVALVLV